MPEAQAASFSLRARQLELILHRISSEPKWDYLCNVRGLQWAVYSGLWTGFSVGSDVCRFQGYPFFDRALPMEKNLCKQSAFSHVKLKPFFLLEKYMNASILSAFFFCYIYPVLLQFPPLGLFETSCSV